MKSRDDLARPQDSLEIEIGLYWLHKLGIISIVLGISFLIVYSFQFFGPLLKLLCGYGVSIALIVLGERMASKEKQKWFAHGLTAGGWSLGYFTTYAAYFVPAVAVVKSLPLIIVLLLAVAAGSLVSALAADSELMAKYSTALAAGSILLSGPGLLSCISLLIVAGIVAFLGNKKQWTGLFKFGLAACYIGHFYCTGDAVSLPDLKLAAFFLCAVWLVFAVGIAYAVPFMNECRQTVTTLACINAAAYATGLTLTNIAGTGLNQCLLMAGGSVYLAAARWLNRRAENQLQTVHILLGLSLINCAKVIHFSGLSVLTVDIIEIAVLGTLAAQFKLKSFRWFAILLCCTLFPAWTVGAASDFANQSFGFHSLPYIKIGLWAVIALCSLAAIYSRKYSVVDAGTNIEKYSDFYYGAANLMLVLVISQIVDPSWARCALMLQSVANGVVALKYKNNYRTIIAAIWLAFSSYLFLMHTATWQTVPAAVSIVSLYCIHAYGRRPAPAPESATALLNWAFALCANVLLTLFILHQLPTDYRSAALGLEGLALLVFGFRMPDRFFRMSGLLVLLLLTGKLLLVDISHFDTAERIVSFIAAGVVFLLASYGYGRFTRAFDDDAQCQSPGQAQHPAGTGWKTDEVAALTPGKTSSATPAGLWP